MTERAQGPAIVLGRRDNVRVRDKRMLCKIEAVSVGSDWKATVNRCFSAFFCYARSHVARNHSTSESDAALQYHIEGARHAFTFDLQADAPVAVMKPEAFTVGLFRLVLVEQEQKKSR